MIAAVVDSVVANSVVARMPAGSAEPADARSAITPVGASSPEKVSAAPRYVFAWGPTVDDGNPVEGTPGTAGDINNVRPSLIRITIQLVDPNGRLPDGQRIELIYPIKPAAL